VLPYTCNKERLDHNSFERKILRRIFGPTKERDSTWRIQTNDELKKLIGNKTIINDIKSQRLGWLGHVHRMPDE
jgi:hypothetical protein